MEDDFSGDGELAKLWDINCILWVSKEVEDGKLFFRTGLGEVFYEA